MPSAAAATAANVALRRIRCRSLVSPSSRLATGRRRRIQLPIRTVVVPPQPFLSYVRCFHTSPLVFDETKELSDKEKKKLLKSKAKAAMAEKEEKKDDSSSSSDSETESTAEKKKIVKEKVTTSMAKKKEGSEMKDEDKSSSKEKDKPSSKKEAKKSAETPTTTEKASVPEVEITQDTVKEYSYPELTADAAKHKAGLDDPTRPDWQNPLHHNNPDMQKCYPEDFDSPEEFEKAVLPAPPLDPGDGSVVAPPYMHELADEIVHLTMLEYNELINKIADHYGFQESDLAPDDNADGGGDDDEDAGGGAPVEEKNAFDIKLVSFDAKAKIKIIKEVRTIVTGLGLKEAKTMVEGAPIVVQKGLNKEDAEQVKAKLEELGAVIEVV